MASTTYTVERSRIISAPPDRVYPLIVDFHQWPRWSPWEDADPELHRAYSGNGEGVGAVYAWSGNRKAGAGRMEIVEVEENRRVEIALDFQKPFKSTSKILFTLEPVDAGTGVTWTMTGKKTLTTKVMGIFKSMDSLVGPDFEKGLARLKATTEK